MAIGYLPQFDSFKKGFLLKEPPDHSDRTKLERFIELTHTQAAPETQVKNIKSNSILHYIQYLRNTFGPAPKEDVRLIPYAKVAKLFKRVKE
jgi:hypothetical protein